MYGTMSGSSWSNTEIRWSIYYTMFWNHEWCQVHYLRHHGWNQMFYSLTPWLQSNVSFIDSMSETRCYIQWHHEWDQMFYSLTPWVRPDVLFVDTMSETRCYIHWHHEWDQMFYSFTPRVRPDVLFLDTMSETRCWSSILCQRFPEICKTTNTNMQL
jgi:hypothetical protein